MRNPERIEPFMNELTEIWQSNFPDWRFGQFISNVFGEVSNITGTDIFYLEENQMMNAIKQISWIRK